MVKRLFLIAIAISAVVLATLVPSVVRADIVDEAVVYTVNDQPYEGYFVKNEGFGDNQPIVLLIHDWNGLGDYEKRRANMLAEQGYAAFAVDLYGQGVRPTTPDESRAESGKLYDDRQALRDRLLGSLTTAQQMAGVDPERVVVIGYCFGGAAVLEMARSGAEVDGFVSFHGGLATPADQDFSQVQGRVLVLHGTEDPVAPMSDVASLAADLTEAEVNYDMDLYGGALHAFTVWGGADYDAHADIQSWRSLLSFLAETIR